MNTQTPTDQEKQLQAEAKEHAASEGYTRFPEIFNGVVMGYIAGVKSRQLDEKKIAEDSDTEEFLLEAKATRHNFSVESKIGGWWYNQTANRRVSIENVLIMYDQMVERLNSLTSK